MSEEDWNLSGPGVQPHNPMLDGAPSRWGKRKEQEPGSVRGPGSRRTRPRSRTKVTYDHWLSVMEMATWGMEAKNTVRQDVLAKNIKALVTDPSPDGMNELHKRLRSAFEVFAADVKSGRVSVRGKDTWFVFYGRRAKYLETARVARGAAKARETDIESTPGW